jgi:hypothetical protein
MFLEIRKLLSERNSGSVEEVKGLIGVHVQLCESMPACTGTKQSQNICIVWLWKEGIKYGDGTLIR